MSILWKSPGEQPDPAVIARMRQHFPKPSELMPIAWFMGEIVFYELLAEESPQTLDAKEFCRALNDIAGGIFCFPEVYYVPVWKDWFRYLLPDIILRSDEPANFNDYSRWILVKAIIAFFNIYPHEIDEEYAGFRDDVIQTLGTRAIPRKLARETLLPGKENSPLFVDIWDVSYQIENWGFVSFEEVNISLLFCLKYFDVSTNCRLGKLTVSDQQPAMAFADDFHIIRMACHVEFGAKLESGRRIFFETNPQTKRAAEPVLDSRFQIF